ncbi:hypothetical protein FA13DRAFT_19356 [Coprinellus micaceus]|uniref:Uncharacterized protein n=1 Tax=Coprinellus micaceus TaxID=71717 RepID=A0A4Y7U1P0_COPMI|nr:hypothetical protein FA13DRAFT_19356 [Coprinellus micaceus]
MSALVKDLLKGDQHDKNSDGGDHRRAAREPQAGGDVGDDSQGQRRDKRQGKCLPHLLKIVSRFGALVAVFWRILLAPTTPIVAFASAARPGCR